LGKNINGDIIIGDLQESLHTLVAGTTGSGKSVCLNTMLTSILFRTGPDEVKLLLVDPKKVELRAYNGLPHMIVKNAIEETSEAINALKWLTGEMMYRYDLLKQYNLDKIASFHNLPDYKSGKLERMPYILCVLDEIGDLLATGKKEVEELLRRLVALARATGIFLIGATQKPTADVITTTIKSNFPSRIAFKVNNGTDSRTILDENGAECLRGKGDMLFKDNGKTPVRLQGTFMERSELNDVLNFIRDNNEADFDEEIQKFVENGNTNILGGAAGKDASFENDEFFIPALRQAVYARVVSASGIQRKFSLGFNRASRIVDTMEELGYVAPKQGNSSKPREMLLSIEEFESKYGE
ncbi:MAG: FtsK/SpoIIIE domain-containing protein, partial [Firmicutes bacterium]|nr:FtsK/SpoIIIE domain-containing protein [Bacillota bacterium]